MLFSQVVEQLTAKGLILKKGTIVDSTIIAAPTYTKNKERKRNSDAHQTHKGEHMVFRLLAHGLNVPFVPHLKPNINGFRHNNTVMSHLSAFLNFSFAYLRIRT